MTPDELNRGRSRTNAIRRLVQLLTYVSVHRAGFFRRDLGAHLELSEESTRRWLSTLEEEGLVYKWRRRTNEAYIWRPTFELKRLTNQLEQVRRAER